MQNKHLFHFFEIKGMVNATAENENVEYFDLETINEKINSLADMILEELEGPGGKVIGVVSR